MDKETKTEAVIFTGLAAFLAALWWINRQNGGGTGLEDQFPSFGDSGGLPALPAGAASNFDIGGSTYNVGTSPPGSGSCGCPTCPATGNAIAFGSNQDLAAYVNGLPDYTAWLKAAQPGGSY